MANDSSNHVVRVISWANEGSGSASDTDFANFLNMSRRSVFEVANILMILSKDNYLPSETVRKLLSELEEESRMILAFRRTLLDQ
jgi:four helix bundle protein